MFLVLVHFVGLQDFILQILLFSAHETAENLEEDLEERASQHELGENEAPDDGERQCAHQGGGADILVSDAQQV